MPKKKNWNKFPKRPSMKVGLKMTVYHSVELQIAIKNNEVDLYVLIWHHL